MMEKAYKFGKKKNLVGIGLWPDATLVRNNRPAVLFLNAGLLHRVGPFRFNVDMARILATAGYYTIRFDVSGIGDSIMHKDSMAYSERIKGDVIEIMDFLQEQFGIKRFLLIGLCSGAENAHAVAAEDRRVSGIIMMDGFTYPTIFFYLLDYVPYFMNPLRLINRVVNRIKKKFSPAVKENSNNQIFVRQFPPKEKVAHELDEMVQRGVNILNIYSGKITGYNYANQYRDMFRSVNFKGKMQLQFFKNADHTFSSIAERKRMMDCIFGWIEEKNNTTKNDNN